MFYPVLPSFTSYGHSFIRFFVPRSPSGSFFFHPLTSFTEFFFCFFYRCRYHRNGGGAKSSSSAELQLSARVASMTIADVSPRFALKVGPRYRVFSLSLSLSLSLSVLFFNRVGPSAAAGQSNAPVAVVDVE